MKRAPKTSPSRPGPNGSVRVIAGQWRGRKLPVANVEGLRPTTDRNKETLFNWLMHKVSGARCLDVFAGSGGLGIEALSRYADHCLFIEQDKTVAGNLRTNLTALKASGDVVVGNALTTLAGLTGPYDLVFVDPPFHQGLVAPALTLLFERNLLAVDGLIYLEQEASAPAPQLPAEYSVIRQKGSSQLSYYLIERTG